MRCEGGLTARMRVSAVVVLLLAGASFTSTAVAAPALPGLKVSGRNLLAGGKPVVLRGVNRSGTEYACIQGFGIFDGPSGDASVRAIASWHVNFVRAPAQRGLLARYQRRQAAVQRARLPAGDRQLRRAPASHGIYAELSLAWGAPGHTPGDVPAPRPGRGPLARDVDEPGEDVQERLPGAARALGRAGRDARTACCGGGIRAGATYGPPGPPLPTAGMQQAVNGDARRRLPRADRDPRHQLRATTLALARVRAAGSAAPAGRRGPRVRQERLRFDRRASTGRWPRWPARCR